MSETLKLILEDVSLGEDSGREFKENVHNIDSLASEMAAMANLNGGIIYIGVTDNSQLSGIESNEVKRINQLISNAASQHIRSPLNVVTENVGLDNGKIVIILKIPKGIDKPYFDKNGVIWLKCGSDKRRINSKEELRRLFQLSEQFYADELPTKAGVDKLNKPRFSEFLRNTFKTEYPENEKDQILLLQNMNLVAENGNLNLSGVLLFGNNPAFVKPQFIVKAISYPGNAIHPESYLDSEDYEGVLKKQFDGAMGFIRRNMHKIQGNNGVNALGQSEIPEVVFEEILVNALVHRDYFVSAPIRIFIYNNRIEIVSPGHLPNNLTIEKILMRNSNIRNPILVSYIAKGILPYKGLGSGIKRALDKWTDIEFINDQDGCLFTAIIKRQEIPVSGKMSGKMSGKIVSHIRGNADITIPELAALIGVSERTIERNINQLRKHNLLRRIGPAKGGYWELMDD